MLLPLNTPQPKHSMNKANEYAGRIYLAFICAEDYPELAPEHKSARWYDIFLFLIPMLGILIFPEVIRARHSTKPKH